jgi:hypothetical protein
VSSAACLSPNGAKQHSPGQGPGFTVPRIFPSPERARYAFPQSPSHLDPHCTARNPAPRGQTEVATTSSVSPLQSSGIGLDSLTQAVGLGCVDSPRWDSEAGWASLIWVVGPRLRLADLRTGHCSFAPLGLDRVACGLTHGLRRGLRSFAAPRLWAPRTAASHMIIRRHRNLRLRLLIAPVLELVRGWPIRVNPCDPRLRWLLSSHNILPKFDGPTILVNRL